MNGKVFISTFKTGDRGAGQPQGAEGGGGGGYLLGAT